MTGSRPRLPWAAELLLATLVAWLPPTVTAASIAEQLQALQLDAPRQRLPAPLFELSDSQGQRISLVNYRGQVVLLNFWATFCQPCRDEMPAIAALENEFSEQGLVVLAIAVDRGSPKAVQKFIQQYGIGFGVPLDPDGSVRNAYEIEALPTSYLIGKDGRFIARAVGDRAWNSSEFRSLIAALLAETNMPEAE